MRTRMSRLALAAGAVGLSLMLLSAGPAGAAQPKQSLGRGRLRHDVLHDGPDRAALQRRARPNTNHDIITKIPPVNAGAVPGERDGARRRCAPGHDVGLVVAGGDAAQRLVGRYHRARATTRPVRSRSPGRRVARTRARPRRSNFWAYALGAVDYVTFPNTDAPAKGLTQAQMIGIYTCNPSTHQPFFHDWSQVGGKPGGIVRYAPQAGSGTLSFFQTKMLNGGDGRPELRLVAPGHPPRGARRYAACRA